jgi:hypothetical protein
MLQCSRHKHRLECITACEHCHGSSCDAENWLMSDDDEDDDAINVVDRAIVLRLGLESCF